MLTLTPPVEVFDTALQEQYSIKVQFRHLAKNLSRTVASGMQLPSGDTYRLSEDEEVIAWDTILSIIDYTEKIHEAKLSRLMKWIKVPGEVCRARYDMKRKISRALNMLNRIIAEQGD